MCYKTISQIRLRLNASVVSKRLQNVCISRPESWIFCIKIDDDFQWLNYKDRMAKCHQCRKKEEVGVAFVSLVPATHWTPPTLWARSWLWRTCWPLARCSFTISVRESTRNHGVEGSPLKTDWYAGNTHRALSLRRLVKKHCQRHNGPEGWVHLIKVTSWGHITS